VKEKKRKKRKKRRKEAKISTTLSIKSISISIPIHG
jgi:hypothetical protein